MKIHKISLDSMIHTLLHILRNIIFTKSLHYLKFHLTIIKIYPFFHKKHLMIIIII